MKQDTWMKYKPNLSSQKQAQPFLIQICYSPMAIYTHVFKNTNRFLPQEKDKSIPNSPAYITCRAGSYREPLQTPNCKTWNILAQARQMLPNNRTHNRTEDKSGYKDDYYYYDYDYDNEDYLEDDY